MEMAAHMKIGDHEIRINKDTTVRKNWYYCVLGVSERKVIYGSSIDIVYRKCLRSYEKKEVSFDPFPLASNENTANDAVDEIDDDIPF